MALDRQSIEKRDFPIGRRGYDPDAVDSHLAAVAAEVDQLRRESRERPGNLATAASEQVRAIVEAAEQSAADIARQAEADASGVRQSADADARASREKATEEARSYVEGVSEASRTLQQRVDAIGSELGELVETLQTRTNRLNADLDLLQGELAQIRDATGVGRRFEPEGDEIAAGAAEPATAATAAVASPTPEEELFADTAEEAPLEEATVVEVESLGAEPLDEPDLAEAAAAGGGEEGDDAEGARLVALNMALNGSSREETDQYLAENFDLADRAALLDEVYATVEG